MSVTVVAQVVSDRTHGVRHNSRLLPAMDSCVQLYVWLWNLLRRVPTGCSASYHYCTTSEVQMVRTGHPMCLLG
jgi:hypothetical protein